MLKVFANQLSRLIPRFLKKIIFRLTGRCIPFGDESVLFRSSISHLCECKKDLFFIQIGANDGISFDDFHPVVREHGLSGLVVEPLSEYFEQLKTTYLGMTSVKPIHIALHATDKVVEMYHVDQACQGIPEFAKGIGSFDVNHHHCSGVPDEMIIKETVNCVTWRELLLIHDVDHVDIVQIDTEGYDYEILKMINADDHCISIIRCEHGVGSGVMSRQELREVYNYFRSQGFTVVIGESDLTAVRKHISDAVASKE